jgi:D-alanyl-D-alanine dipeptidase
MKHYAPDTTAGSAAVRALTATRAAGYTEQDPATAIQDLITDLRHALDADNAIQRPALRSNWADLLRRASANYRAEVREAKNAARRIRSEVSR